jgi:hypothetical protein
MIATSKTVGHIHFGGMSIGAQRKNCLRYPGLK